MGKVVICARSVSEVEDGGVLMIPDGAIVTPLARELASARQIRLQNADTNVSADKDAPKHGQAPSAALIAEIVREVLTRERRSRDEAPSGAVRVVRGRGTPLVPVVGAAQQAPGTRVSSAEILGPADGAPFTSGYLGITGDPWRRSTGVTELLIVLEGELDIWEGSNRAVAHPSDVIYIPQGTQTTLSSPGWAKVFYVRVGEQ